MVKIEWTTQTTSAGPFEVLDGFFTANVNSAFVGEEYVYTHYRVNNTDGAPITIDVKNSSGTSVYTPSIPNGESDIIVKTNKVGTPVWFMNFDGETVQNILTDDSGNMYINGYSGGNTVTLRDDSGDYTINNGGDPFAYYAKYNSSNVYQWSVKITSTNDIAIFNAKVHSQTGDSYFTGRFYETSTIHHTGGTESFNPDVALVGDIFVIGLTSNGTLKWNATLTSGSTNVPFGMDIDASGNVYATGIYNGDPLTIIDGNASVYTQPGGGGPTVGYGYLVKFAAPDGDYRWFYRFDSSNSILMKMIDVTSHGVHVMGTVTGADVEIINQEDSVVGTIGHDTVENSDGMFISKFTLEGAYQWSVRVDGPSNEYNWITVHDNIVDSKGSVYINGVVNGSNIKIYNNANSLVKDATLGETSSSNGFIAKFNAEGVFQWISSIQSTEGAININWQMKIDSRDNLYLSGNSFSEGPVPEGFQLSFFNRDSATPAFTVNQFINPFPTYIFSYSSSGNFRWVSHVGDDSFVLEPLSTDRFTKKTKVSRRSAETRKIQKREFLGILFSNVSTYNNRFSVTPGGRVYLPLTAGSLYQPLYINNSLIKTLEFPGPQPYLVTYEESGDLNLPLIVGVGAVAAIGAYMLYNRNK